MSIIKPLGSPLPDTSAHSVSVSLPNWSDVVGYEEKDARVLNALKGGYPRFVYHPYTKSLFEKMQTRFASHGEFCIAFPSQKTANECIDFVAKYSDVAGKTDEYEKSGVFAVTLPESARGKAKEFWQHAGMIVSSRQAEAILNGGGKGDATKEKEIIKNRIGEQSGYSLDDIYFYPSGAGAVYFIHQILLKVRSGQKSIQLGFPYVDTLKVQQKFGSGVHFLDYKDENDLAAVEKIIKQGKISAVFCEIPSNPLLRTINIPQLSKILRANNVMLVVDDTISTWLNVDLSNYADVVVTSLTKFFSGTGDVLAGSVIINRKSPFYSEFKKAIDKNYEDLTYFEDIKVLEKNSRDFPERMKKVNKTAELLADFLKIHPEIGTVNYPKYNNRAAYDAIKKKDGGYGGLLSITLKFSPNAITFHDTLEVDKGPSLGTNFTLASPYTLLAHYNELDWARKYGVTPELIRVSVGLEEPEVLKSVFRRALDGLSGPTKSKNKRQR